MSNLDKVLQYRKQVDKARRQVDMAEGALEHAKEDLAQKFNCETINDGVALLSRLKSKVKKLHNKATIKLKKFERKWKDQLES